MHTRFPKAFAIVGSLLDVLGRDLYYSIRSLRRNPGLLVISALSLGLGIGVNTVLYMGISKIYESHPTMYEPKRVVGVELATGSQFSYPDYEDLLQSATFDSALGFRATGLNFGSTGHLERVRTTIVTGNYFEVLGISAQAGRTFSATEMRPETDPRVVVVTSGFLHDHLRNDPAVLGKSIFLDGESFTVIGVLPKSYQAVTGWGDRGIYVPLSELVLPSIDDRAKASLTVLARLRPNSSIQDAQEGVVALNRRLDAALPHRVASEVQPPAVFLANTLQFRGASGQLLLMKIAWVMAISVLLIASVNVTGLLLARATDRQGELAIRCALGAGRIRIAQLVLVESFLVALTGAAVGIPLALLLNSIPMPPPMAPLQDAMALDYRVLPYSAALVAMATLICGVMPVVRTMRMNLNSQMKRGGRFTPRTWLREMIVAGQVAMTFVLVVSALFCVRSQIRIMHTDFGFDIDRGVVAQFDLPWNEYSGAKRIALAGQLTTGIEQVPGVLSVSVADLVPLGGNGLIKSFHPAGRNDLRGTRPDTFSVGPGYFRTLGIRLSKGREFDASDQVGAPSVVIVNETFARTYFSRTDIIGQPVPTIADLDSRVVGVVRDNRIDTIGEIPRSVVYYSFAQHPSDLCVHVRSAVPPDTLVAAVQRAITAIDATLPVNVQTLRRATNLELTMRRVGMVLMGILGAVGLMLAAIGVYGVMAYVAAARTADVAIRMSLGASPGYIRWEILRRALILILPSVTLGAAISLAIMPAFRTFLAGVSPFDPVSIGGAAVIFLLIGLTAAYVPAQRNACLDPMQTLRRQ